MWWRGVWGVGVGTRWERGGWWAASMGRSLLGGSTGGGRPVAPTRGPSRPRCTKQTRSGGGMHFLPLAGEAGRILPQPCTVCTVQ